MLVIRKEQMKIFEIDALRKFEDEMIQHVKKFAAKQYEFIGEDDVRRIVTMGIERAEKYGFTNRGPVRFYIELMFMFGSDFDSDPQYSWASKVLNDEGIDDQMEKADLLYDQAMDFVDKIAGPEYIHEKEALRRAVQSRFEDLPNMENYFERDLLNYLNRIHPQKIKSVGQSGIRVLIQQGQELAKRHDVSHVSEVALLVCLMFAFGHGCFTDPQFSWIEGTLGNASILDPSKKIELLYSKMMTYFNESLSLMEKR